MTADLRFFEGTIIGPHERPIAWDVTLPAGEKPAPLIIFSHGFKGFKDWGAWTLMARAIARRGWGVLKFNFSFDGTTPDAPEDFADLEAFGRNTISAEVADLHFITAAVREHRFPWTVDVNTEKIVLMGHSRGGGVTLVAFNEAPHVRAAIVLASISHFRRWDDNTLNEWQQKGVLYIENARTGQQMPLYYSLAEDIIQHQERFDLARHLPGNDRPLLILHGKEDPTVPYTEGLQIFEWAPNGILCLHPTANHTFGAKHPWPLPTLPAPLQWAVDHIHYFLSTALDKPAIAE